MAGNKMQISVKETSIVRPAKDTPKTNLWISNLDLLVLRVHVPTVYFYRPNACSNFFDVQVLKKARSEVLVPFYPVAGRLGRDENGRIEIQCHAEGVLFIEAHAISCVMDDLGDFTPGLEMLQLVPTIDCSDDISSYPLFGVQVTSFKCGGICLGVCLHHIIVDGSSGIHFINSWSEIARGISITISPFIDRTLIRARVPPIPTIHHSEYDAPLSMMIKTQRKSTPTVTKILEITPDQLSSLKSKSTNGTATYSTFETLAAHIWRCLCMALDLPNDQPTKLYSPVTGRSRLNPSLPPGYFGNAHFTTTVVGLSGEIQSAPLSHTAEKIHETFKKMGSEYLISALDYLQVQPDLTALTRSSDTYRCPNFNITSWTTLPVYDADFGWGRPVFMGPASVVFGGTVTIMRSSINDGSLRLIICLEKQQMQTFQNLLYQL